MQNYTIKHKDNNLVLFSCSKKEVDFAVILKGIEEYIIKDIATEDSSKPENSSNKRSGTLYHSFVENIYQKYLIQSIYQVIP